MEIALSILGVILAVVGYGVYKILKLPIFPTGPDDSMAQIDAQLAASGLERGAQAGH